MSDLRLSSLLLIAAVLLLAGCATPGGTLAAPEATVTHTQTAAQQLGDAMPGDIVDLPVGNPFTERSVVVGDDYSAASGRQCRRLRAETGKLLPRIVCKNLSGQWYSPRSLVAES